MNEDLVMLIKGLRPKGRIPRPDEYVFTLNGERVESVKTAFNAALKRAVIEGVSVPHAEAHDRLSHGYGGLYPTGDSCTVAAQRHQNNNAVYASVTKTQKESG